MPSDGFRVKFWGVRGSLPVPGRDTSRIGGNTPCTEITDGETTILIDAGTGIRVYGNSIMKSDIKQVTLLLSHYHWDHLQGFCFFSPLQKKEFQMDVYGEDKAYGTVKDIVAGQMTHPYFPVTVSDLPGKVNFHSIKKDEVVKIGNFEVKAYRLRHPDGCLGYKISKNGRAVMYCSDYEHFENQSDAYFASEFKDIDCLIYDSSYTDEEYLGQIGPVKKNWGHSTWQKGCSMAALSNVKLLVLFHHELNRTDEKILEIESNAKKVYPNTVAAYEGLEIEI